MKLPNEPFMGERYYRPYAAKVVKKEVAQLEVSLNQTVQEKAVSLVAALLTIGIFLLVTYEFSFLYGIVSGVVVLALGIVGSLFVEHRDPKDGIWKVKVGSIGYPRGGTVDLICERVVDGKIVERMVR